MTPAFHSENDSSPAQQFWEERYQQRERVWSGKANAILVEVVAALPPGRALDLGCGEGGDALWLAERGWQVTAVDISATALSRAAAAAATAGVADWIDFQQHDLAASFPAGAFDLVSAQFLQSPVALPREQILQAAARAVAPGGLLLIVEHGAFPPWAHNHEPNVRFPTPEETLAALALPSRGWRIEQLGAPARQATGPNGESGTHIDNVVAVRRLGP